MHDRVGLLRPNWVVPQGSLMNACPFERGISVFLFDFYGEGDSYGTKPLAKDKFSQKII